MKIILLTKFGLIESGKIKDFLTDKGHQVWVKTNNINSHPSTQKRLEETDLVISYFYPYIIDDTWLNIPKLGFINVHISLLPYNRGAHPNVWSIVEETPAGVTIHKIDKGIDTGEILHQIHVSISQEDTGETLYKRLLATSVLLFSNWWVSAENFLVNGFIPDWQYINQFKGTYHNSKELASLQNLEIYLSDKEMKTAKKVINILRACTFTGYNGAYIDTDEGRIYYRLIPYKDNEND